MQWKTEAQSCFVAMHNATMPTISSMNKTLPNVPLVSGEVSDDYSAPSKYLETPSENFSKIGKR